MWMSLTAVVIASLASPTTGKSLNILAIETGTDWENSIINAIPGNTITVVDAIALTTVDFNEYDVLYVSDVFDANSTPAWASVLNDRMEDVLAYINAGGDVIVGSQQYDGFNSTNGDEYNFLGGLADVPAGTGGCEDDVVITEPGHGLFDGLTSADLSGWGCSYHGLLSLGTLPVLATNNADVPVVRGGPIGGGTVLVWTLDPDFHFNAAALTLVENALNLVEVGPPDSDGDGVPDDEDECPASILGGTVVIECCETGVENFLMENGCTAMDLIALCADTAGNHGEFVSCVAAITHDWLLAGLITGAQKGLIQSCAAQANIPAGGPGDLDGDGTVGASDLLILLGNWG